MRQVMVFTIMAFATACGTARVHVTPDAVSLNSDPHVCPARVALHIDPSIIQCSTTATTHPFGAGLGYGAIEVRYDFANALAGTIENVVRQHFRESLRADGESCPAGADAIIDAKLAKPAEITVRWVTQEFGEGGGAAIQLAVDVIARRCDGRTVWHTVAQGYGSEERTEGGFLWNDPAPQQFEPAATAALLELARQFDRALDNADLTVLTTSP